ncbi:unnamed protein product [Owenia fusiformis]|uniref:Endonuclease/exonuclease/phosphatase domain-containing protein n=1 Tax=Owenia fusiformis TaxID=6347 RepID=A0A8J1TEW5_OWEFU|nr:unnamed protein product [Owenia fusiformis]
MFWKGLFVFLVVLLPSHCILGQKIGAFNVRIFGQSKAQKPEVMDILKRIVRRYDVILIQEIRDAKETAILDLLALVNEGASEYSLVQSARLGRTSSKEQYAYIYRNELSVTDEFVFNDISDIFEREPYIVRFKAPTKHVTDFTLVGLHTKPTDAVDELDGLIPVMAQIKDRFADNPTENIMILGDLNADCNYVTDKEKPALALRTTPGYHWNINDNDDTTISLTTSCAYDRFIVTSPGLFDYEGTTSIFHFDQEYGLTNEFALTVSDHYPIEIEFSPSLPSGKGYKIGSFNIQIFGDTKASKADVMEILSKIIQRYDIIFIQEIRDASGDAIQKLLRLTNSEGPEKYTMAISERLGRSNSKEQYAYIYRLSTTAVFAAEVFDDAQDVFEREPYIVAFFAREAAVPKFVLAGIHVKPSDALAELNALAQVKTYIKNHLNTDEVVFMGDFNADCSYLNAGERDALVLKSSDYYWPIGADVDTTVSKSNCAYDRFVFVNNSEMRTYLKPGSAKPFLFDQEYSLSSELAKAVSDHYPIEMEIYRKAIAVAPVRNNENAEYSSDGQAEQGAPMLTISKLLMLTLIFTTMII